MCGGWVGRVTGLDNFRDEILDDFLGVVPGKGGLVGDALEDVNDFLFRGGLEDVIRDAGRWIDDEIIQPVYEFQKVFFQVLIDDPLYAAAMITAGLIYPPAIPYIVAIKTKSDGGTWEEAIIAGATAYVTQQVALQVGEYVPGIESELAVALTDAGLSASTAASVAQVAVGLTASGLTTGTIEVIFGGSFSDGFAEGAITYGAQFAVSKAAGFIEDKTGFEFRQSKAQTDADGNVVTDEFGQTVYETNASGEIVKEFKKLPNVVQALVVDSIAAELQGKEITKELLLGSISRSLITEEVVGETLSKIDTALLGGDGNLTEDGEYFLSFLTPAVQDAATAIASMGVGAESGAAAANLLLEAVEEYGLESLGEEFVNNALFAVDSLRGVIDEVTAAKTALDEAVVGYETVAEARNAIASELNTISEQYQLEIDRIASDPSGALYTTLVEQFNNSLQAVTDADGNIRYEVKAGDAGYPANLGYTSVEEYYRDVVTQTPTYIDDNGNTQEYASFEQLQFGLQESKRAAKLYQDTREQYETQLLDYNSQLEALQTAFDTASTDYKTANDSLLSDVEALDEEFKVNATAPAIKEFVELINPTFNADQYVALNELNISALDAHRHYVEEGARLGYFVSDAQEDAFEKNAIGQLRSAAETAIGVPTERMTTAQLDEFNRLVNTASDDIYYDDLGNFTADKAIQREYLDAEGNPIVGPFTPEQVASIASASLSYSPDFVNTIADIAGGYDSYLAGEGATVEELLAQDKQTIAKANEVSWLDVLNAGGVGYNETTGRKEYVTALKDGENNLTFFDAITGQNNLLVQGQSIDELAETSPQSWYEATKEIFSGIAETAKTRIGDTAELISEAQLIKSQANEEVGRIVADEGEKALWTAGILAKHAIIESLDFAFTKIDEAAIALFDPTQASSVLNWSQEGVQAKKDMLLTAATDAYEFASNIPQYKKDFAGTTISGLAGLTQDVVSLIRWSGENTKNTTAYQFAENLIQTTNGWKTDEFKAGSAELNRKLSARAVDDPNTPQNEAVIDTLGIIFGAAADHPYEFGLDYIYKEGIQEIAPLIVGGFTYAAGKVGAGVLGKDVSKEFLTKLGFAASGLTDIAESAGGTTEAAYDEALAEIEAALIARRDSNENITWSNKQIEQIADYYAQDIAVKNGMFAAMTTAALLWAGSAALEKPNIGLGTGFDKYDDAFQTYARKMDTDYKAWLAQSGKVAGKEAVSEFTEEFLINDNLETMLAEWNPERNVEGNNLFNGFLGAVIAGPVTFSIDAIVNAPSIDGLDATPSFEEATGRTRFQSTGDTTADLLLLNRDVQETVYAGTADLATVLGTYGLSTDTLDALQDAANDPDFLGSYGQIPDLADRSQNNDVRKPPPNFTEFPTGTQNELYYDPNTDATYKFNNGDWQLGGSGNNLSALTPISANPADAYNYERQGANDAVVSKPATFSVFTDPVSGLEYVLERAVAYELYTDDEGTFNFQDKSGAYLHAYISDAPSTAQLAQELKRIADQVVAEKYSNVTDTTDLALVNSARNFYTALPALTGYVVDTTAQAFVSPFEQRADYLFRDTPQQVLAEENPQSGNTLTGLIKTLNTLAYRFTNNNITQTQFDILWPQYKYLFETTYPIIQTQRELRGLSADDDIYSTQFIDGSVPTIFSTLPEASGTVQLDSQYGPEFNPSSSYDFNNPEASYIPDNLVTAGAEVTPEVLLAALYPEGYVTDGSGRFYAQKALPTEPVTTGLYDSWTDDPEYRPISTQGQSWRDPLSASDAGAQVLTSNKPIDTRTLYERLNTLDDGGTLPSNWAGSNEFYYNNGVWTYENSNGQESYLKKLRKNADGTLYRDANGNYERTDENVTTSEELLERLYPTQLYPAGPPTLSSAGIDYTTTKELNDQYEADLLQYFFTESIDNGWAATDAADYVFRNGQAIADNMRGMDAAAFDAYYVTGAEGQTFNTIDPSPPFTASSFKKFMLDKYNFNEEDYYASLANLGSDPTAVDTALDVFFSANPDSAKLNSPTVQGFITDNYNSEADVTAALKAEFGEDYIPTAEELDKYVGSRWISGQKTNITERIDAEFYTDAEKTEDVQNIASIASSRAETLGYAPDAFTEAEFANLINPELGQEANVNILNNYYQSRTIDENRWVDLLKERLGDELYLEFGRQGNDTLSDFQASDLAGERSRELYAKYKIGSNVGTVETADLAAAFAEAEAGLPVTGTPPTPPTPPRERLDGASLRELAKSQYGFTDAQYDSFVAYTFRPDLVDEENTTFTAPSVKTLAAAEEAAQLYLTENEVYVDSTDILDATFSQWAQTEEEVLAEFRKERPDYELTQADIDKYVGVIGFSDPDGGQAANLTSIDAEFATEAERDTAVANFLAAPIGGGFTNADVYSEAEARAALEEGFIGRSSFADESLTSVITNGVNRKIPSFSNIAINLLGELQIQFDDSVSVEDQRKYARGRLNATGYWADIVASVAAGESYTTADVYALESYQNLIAEENAKVTTVDEVRAYFESEGFDVSNLTDEELRAIPGLVGDTLDNRISDIDSANEVDAISVTKQEVIDYLIDLGYQESDVKAAADNGEFSGFTGVNVLERDLGTFTSSFQETYETEEQRDARLEAEQQRADTITAFGSYTPTEEEIAQFLDNNEGIADYIAPRQFTRAEAEAAVAAQGISPTVTDNDGNEVPNPTFEVLVNGLINLQGDETTQATQEAAAVTQADPYYIDQGEVDAEFAKYGYFDTTGIDTSTYTGEASESNLEGTISSFVDANYSDEAEARAALEAEGFIIPEDFDFTPFVGQFNNAELGNRVTPFAANNIVTAEEARAALDAVEGIDAYAVDENGDYLITDEQLAGLELSGQYLQTDLGSRVDAQTVTDAEAIAALQAVFGAEYVPSAEEIAQFQGLTPQSGLSTEVARYQDETLNRLEGDIGDLTETVSTLEARINGILAAGGTLDQAIATVSNDLNISITALQDIVTANADKFTTDLQNTLLEANIYTDQRINTINQALQNAIQQFGSDIEAAKAAAAAELGLEVGTLQGFINANEQALTDLGTDVTSLTTRVEDVEDTLAGVVSQIGQPAVYDGVGNVITPATGLYADIDAMITAGFTSEQATAAIQAVLGDPATGTGIYAYIDTLDLATTAQLAAQVSSLEDYVSAQGFATTDDLSGLSDQIQVVADALGKPAEQVTQEDLDYVNDVIQSNILQPDATFTQQDLAYDVNQDGIVNLDDYAILEQLYGGDVSVEGLDPTSQFAATGVFATLAEQERQRQIDAEAARAADLATQQDINEQLEQQIAQQTQITNVVMLDQAIREAEQAAALQRQRQIQAQQLDSDLAEIDYIYDFEGILQRPEQEPLYGSPFGAGAQQFGMRRAAAKGGLIKNETDRLIQLLGE